MGRIYVSMQRNPYDRCFYVSVDGEDAEQARKELTGSTSWRTTLLERWGDDTMRGAQESVRDVTAELRRRGYDAVAQPWNRS